MTAAADRSTKHWESGVAVSIEVTVPNFGSKHRASWLALLELAEVFSIQKNGEAQWAVFGGQMVVLHAAEHGVSVPTDRETTDGGVIANVRVTQHALRELSRQLERLGFEHLAGPQGQGHRFVRGAASIDVLAPDNLGKRARLTTINGLATVEAPGGTQALNRSEAIDVTVGEMTGTIMRPSLLGAILAKIAAASLPGSDRHLRDAALLLTLVDDPLQLAEQLTSSERRRLRAHGNLGDFGSVQWLNIPSPERGVATYQLLVAGAAGRNFRTRNSNFRIRNR